MANGVNGINGGYGNSYNFGLGARREEEAPQNKPAEAQVNNYEETQIDPNKVMEFLAKNDYFVAPKQVGNTVEVDSAAQERIAGYMEQFEMIYGIVVEEFGENLAPAVMDTVMDKLMGMAA